jgi:hypothetical protein
LLGYNVTLDFAVDATAGTLSVNGQNSCGNGTPNTLDLTLLKSAKITAGINDKLTTWDIKAYAIRNTEIRVIGDVSNHAVATLYDVQGKAVLNKNLLEGNLNSMDVQAIRSGIYILFVRDNERMQRFRIPLVE